MRPPTWRGPRELSIVLRHRLLQVRRHLAVQLAQVCPQVLNALLCRGAGCVQGRGGRGSVQGGSWQGVGQSGIGGGYEQQARHQKQQALLGLAPGMHATHPVDTPAPTNQRPPTCE